MPFMYDTVDISSVPYTVFGDIADADAYLQAAIGAAAWQAIETSDDTTKPRALISATRWLDVQQWDGQLTDAAQEHAWPRTGLFYADGSTEVDPDTLPVQFLNGYFELANLLVADPTLQGSLNTTTTPRELHAGSVGMSFFRPQVVQVQTPLPSLVMSWFGLWLGGAASAARPIQASGVCDTSSTPPPFDYNRGI